MSASVTTVETRTTLAPAAWAARRSSLVPIPGSSATARLAPLDDLGGGREQLGVGVGGEAVLARTGA